MLATGRYAQWRSRFLRYIDTRPNGDALRKCILKGPYTPTFVTTPAVPATEDSPAHLKKTSRSEQAQKDKDMQKNLALIAKYFKKLYKPTNNNLRTSSNTRNKNVDTTPRRSSRSNLTGYRHGEEIDEQELEAHYSYMAKIQEVPNADSGIDAEPLEQVQYDTDE
ncbi:hypothetical protein Tco_0650445 [Tanacetum coccineum]